MDNIMFIRDNEDDIYKNKHGFFSNTIYTFDCETVSLFDINGQLKPFDYKKTPDFYRNKLKVSYPYIYMFSVNDKVYYSRDFMSFSKILKYISNERIHKFIYVHNLSYDAQFIFNIIKSEKWNVTNMLALGKRKIISFDIEELNITFRCSYKLTNLSLEKSAERYNCKHKKLKGNLDYNKAHSYKSILSEEEKSYCENDCLVMYDFLSYFLKQYGSIKKIPLTQTGEVRKELKKILPYSYFKEVAKKYPNAYIYYLLTKAFQGGITHSNYLNTAKVFDCLMYDIASSYPYVLAVKEYPTGVFFKIKPSEMEKKKDTHCFLIHCIFKNLKCKKMNRYISDSKIINPHKNNVLLDNGRVIECKYNAEMIITEIDFNIIKQDYNYTEIEFIEVYACRKHYLHINIVKFILEMYKRKTQLKNSDHEIYMKSKQCINALFGIACQNNIKNHTTFDLSNFEIWKAPIINAELYKKTVSEIKENKNMIFLYQVGVWCTAYARERLWDLIEYNTQTDINSIYYDTDSDKLKYFVGLDKIIKDLNNKRNKEVKKVCDDRGLNYSDFEPCDDEGKKYPIGFYDFEGRAKIKTLGAKKYCTLRDGVFSITVAGVPKKQGSKILTNFDDFKKGFIFGYETDKKTLYYNDGLQEPFTYIDCDGNTIYIDWCKYAVIIQPTQYKLGITDTYENLINYMETYRH